MNKKNKETGKTIVHVILISLSYQNRGTLFELIRIKLKNKYDVKKEKNNYSYSAKNNRVKEGPLNSILKPEINFLSPH